MTFLGARLRCPSGAGSLRAPGGGSSSEDAAGGPAAVRARDSRDNKHPDVFAQKRGQRAACVSDPLQFHSFLQPALLKTQLLGSPHRPYTCPHARGAPVGTSGGSRGSAPSPALVFWLCPLAGPSLQLSVPKRKRGAMMLRVEGLSRGTRTKSCEALRPHEPA